MTKTILFLFLIVSSLQTLGQDADTFRDNSEANEPNEYHISAFLSKAQNIRNLDSLELIVQNAVSQTNKNRKLQAQIYEKAGEIFQDRNLYDNAIENYLESLRIYESLQDSTKIADVSNRIGNVYLINISLDNVIQFSSRARDIYLNTNNEKGVLSSSLTIGAAYQKKNDFDNALRIFKTALQNAQSPELVREKAILLGNIGSSYMTLGKLDSGLTYLQQSLSIKQKHSPEGSIIHTLNDLSEIMLLMDNTEESKKYAEEARRRAKISGNANQLRWAHLSLSRNAETTGDYKEAYTHFLKYYQINDSLFGLERENQIKELQVKYETDKKDQAITTLHKEKEIADLRTSIYLISGILILLVGAALYNSQRLRAIKNKKLLEKEQELERMKASFFANISHEFRTPLTLIMSPIETMLEQKPREQQRHHLEIMQKSGKRLLRLINQILDLSKVEAGHLNLEFRNVDLITYLRDITMSFSSLCSSKNISLDFTNNVENFSLSCDAAKLNTVLVNLISNAVKNTGQGGHISVDVNARREEHQLEIKVADSGIGIAEEKLPFIFDRYYQVEGGGSSPDSPGSGIGLALTKQLVELQNGEVKVTSKLNEGTTFVVLLSLKPEQILDSTRDIEITQGHYGFDSVNLTDKPHLPDCDPQDETRDKLPLILIIEDNADVRYYVKSILTNDYQIIEAENGKEGLEKAQLLIPDLIISDVMMPVMDGYEACRRIKKDEKTSHIPVILLTAKASVDSRITGLETEADMYLSKPFVPGELLVCIRNLIESRKRLRERYNREIHLKPSDISINSVDEQFLTKLMSVLEIHYSNADFTVDQLGREVGMSRSQIHRKLQALTNESSSRFIRSFRLQRAMDMISQRAGTISEISYQVGFSSPSYFNKCFLEHYGFTPSTVLEN